VIAKPTRAAFRAIRVAFRPPVALGWLPGRGISSMRILGIVALGAALVGCAASRQEVAARLGDQFIGQNVDSLVVQFGPR